MELLDLGTLINEFLKENDTDITLSGILTDIVENDTKNAGYIATLHLYPRPKDTFCDEIRVFIGGKTPIGKDFAIEKYINRNVEINGKVTFFPRTLTLQITPTKESSISLAKNHANKNKLPLVLKNLFVITSKNASVLRDFKHIYTSEPEKINYIYVQMNEADAAQQIVGEINKINKKEISSENSLICIIRGGGEPEQLKKFNDSELCDCVSHSKIPVLAAIGHADFLPFITDVVSPSYDLDVNKDLINPTALAFYLNKKYNKLYSKK